MKHKYEDRLLQDKNRQLDVPQEANRNKHINFSDIEHPVNDNRKNTGIQVNAKNNGKKVLKK